MTKAKTKPKAGAATAAGGSKFVPCTARALPPELLELSAATATAENPANAPTPGGVAALLKLLADLLFGALKDAERPVIESTPQHIAMLTQKYWGSQGKTIPTYFLDTRDAALKAKLLAAFNAWGDNVVFVETGSVGNSLCRVSRQRGGYWSYLGTDYLHIPQGQPTMNLEGFTLNTPESEWLRVPTHEAGHARGFPHEHMRKELVALLDRAKTISYFGRTQGWSPQEVMDQVLTPLDDRSIMSTPADQDSIMCYQLPGSITTTGQPIRGGARINDTDRAFALRNYPRPDVPSPPPPPPPPGGAVEIVVPKPGTYRLVTA